MEEEEKDLSLLHSNYLSSSLIKIPSVLLNFSLLILLLLLWSSPHAFINHFLVLVLVVGFKGGGLTVRKLSKLLFEFFFNEEKHAFVVILRLKLKLLKFKLFMVKFH